MGRREQQAVVRDDQAGRIDRVVQEITGLSRRQLRGLFAVGGVRLNDQTCTQTFARVQVGDRLVVSFDPQQHYPEPTQPWHDSAFRIVFEDNHLIVVDKAAGFLSVPAGPLISGTVIDRLGRYLGRSGQGRRAYVVHRLDRHVSGLLVFAKDERTQYALREQFEQRKPRRRYVAIVRGLVAKEHGTIRTHLATGAGLTRYSTPDTARGELAVTHYQVQQRLDDATVLAVQLETGRRNQIRVHLAEAGHPVLGDTRYQSRQARHHRWRAKRLALHATDLGFTHPSTGQSLNFQSALPQPMRRFMETARPRRSD